MLDFNKPVQTKSGKQVEILTTDGRGQYPIVGYIEGSDSPACWTREGHLVAGNSEFSMNSLENIPQKRSGWVNIFSDYPPEVTDCPRRVVGWHAFNTQQEAQNAGRGYGDYVASAYIEWEE